jgi:hypothetical protein
MYATKKATIHLAALIGMVFVLVSAAPDFANAQGAGPHGNYWRWHHHYRHYYNGPMWTGE